MRSVSPSVLALVIATALAAPRAAHAQCDHLTRPIAARLSAALTPAAPAWARPLIAPAQLMRFDSADYHPMTFFLGYSVVAIERLGVHGATPFRATVALRCRDRHAELIEDPYAWANARARELHVQIANAEQAAGFAAEVVALSTGHRPEGASASRQHGVFVVEITLAPHQGETSPQSLHLQVTREGEITRP
ncbi:MAG: hypothetical protein WCJ30_10910 [Deltaproteobacteria bacterium]